MDDSSSGGAAAPPAADLEYKKRLARAVFERRLRRARGDLLAFVETCVKDDKGQLLRLAPIHVQRINHVRWCWEHGKRALILGPFASGKTAGLILPLIAHELGKDNTIRIKMICNDDPSAIKRVTAVRKLIETPQYRMVFPNVRRGVPWTGHMLTLVRDGHAIDPSLDARGVFATGVGSRSDMCILDDVVDQRTSLDAGQRQKVLDFIEQTWLSRLEPNGRVCAIGTAWHQADAWHQLMQKPGWCTLIQKVSDDCTQIEQELIGVTAEELASYPAVISPQTAA